MKIERSNDTENKNKKYIETNLNNFKSEKKKEKRLEMNKKIARSKNPSSLVTLLEMLDDPCERNRDFIVKELEKRKGLDLDIIYNKLSNQPWYVKCEALRILGLKKDPKSILHLKTIFNEPNVEVRRCIVQTLGKIGGQEVLPFLTHFSKDENRFVRKTAEEVLQKLSDLKFA